MAQRSISSSQTFRTARAEEIENALQFRRLRCAEQSAGRRWRYRCRHRPFAVRETGRDRLRRRPIRCLLEARKELARGALKGAGQDPHRKPATLVPGQAARPVLPCQLAEDFPELAASTTERFPGFYREQKSVGREREAARAETRVPLRREGIRPPAGMGRDVEGEDRCVAIEAENSGADDVGIIMSGHAPAHRRNGVALSIARTNNGTVRLLESEIKLSKNFAVQRNGDHIGSRASSHGASE